MAKEYLVPFPDNSFDVVILTSVFSHMLPQDINRYLSEIQRVLKVDGRCFVTYYLLDKYAQEQVKTRKASQPFYHAFDGYLSTSRITPENTVAYPEATVRELYARNGLKIEEPIFYGSWSGREKFLSYQDVVIARKEFKDPVAI